MESQKKQSTTIPDGDETTTCSSSSNKRKHDCDCDPGADTSSVLTTGLVSDATAGVSMNQERNEGQDEAYLWGTDMHSSFVAAIFEEGLKHSSPSVIMENMVCPPKTLTSERVKSHLQKFRKSKQKEKQKFMDEYATFVELFQKIGKNPRLAFQEPFNNNILTGGKAAAFVTHSVLARDKRRRVASRRICEGDDKGSIKRPHDFEDLNMHSLPTKIAYPKLTEEEKKTAIGVSLYFTMGLVEHMKRYVGERRSTFAADETGRFHGAMQEHSKKEVRIDRDIFDGDSAEQAVYRDKISKSTKPHGVTPPFATDDGVSTDTAPLQTEPRLPSLRQRHFWLC